MPRFDFNPSDVSSGLPVFPKGSYEVVLGEPKSFYRAGKNGKPDNYGIFFKSKIGEGAHAGKPLMINCYQHNEDSKGFSKQYQMSALGFVPVKQDDDFNKAHGSEDWSFNTDDNSCGNGWHLMKGQTIIIDFDIKMDDDGNQQQVTKGIRPLNS